MSVSADAILARPGMRYVFAAGRLESCGMDAGHSADVEITIHEHAASWSFNEVGRSDAVFARQPGRVVRIRMPASGSLPGLGHVGEQPFGDLSAADRIQGEVDPSGARVKEAQDLHPGVGLIVHPPGGQLEGADKSTGVEVERKGRPQLLARAKQALDSFVQRLRAHHDASNLLPHRFKLKLDGHFPWLRGGRDA